MAAALHAQGPPARGNGMATATSHAMVSALRALIAVDAGALPRPAGGRTLDRWRRLAVVAGRDLSLAKLYEGHCDAMAILDELDGPAARTGVWGTWCAEPPQARLNFVMAGHDSLRIDGCKSWCSGAAIVDHAVVSGWNEAGQPCLAAVSLRQPGVNISNDGWAAVGMADTHSVDVLFDGAIGTAIGAPDAYLRRPGFWHGGAGIAACWWGGAAGIAQAAHEILAARAPDAHQSAHLGAIDIALASSAALLREAAIWIDEHPDDNAHAWALRARLATESAAERVLHHVGRALGAGPLCKQPALARAMADLPVYLRQSHAERDQAALGTMVAREASTWQL